MALACTGEPAKQAAPTVDRPATDVQLSVDTAGRPLFPADAALDSAAAVQRLAELQGLADSSRVESLAAPALLRAGVLKLRLYPADIDGTIARRRPQDFVHNEIAGGWLYNGADFDTLLARYAGGPLADDARYAKLFVLPGGECEGRMDCYIGLALGGPVDFLKSDPTSPFSTVVVQTINRELRRLLAEVPDLREATEMYDPVSVQASVARYDSVARELPPPVRDAAFALLDSVWARLGRGGR